MEYNFRLIDFNFYDSQNELFEDDDEYDTFQSKFIIQMFGINEEGKTCSIVAENYTPFFYILVNDTWNETMKTEFLKHIELKCKIQNKHFITGCKFVKQHKLYGFDNRKQHKFIKFEFINLQIFNKVKNMWYKKDETSYSLLKTKNNIGYNFKNTYTQIYESNIPPLLRFFHIKEISPSGWISIPLTSENIINRKIKKTTCDFEFTVDYKDIIPLNEKETRVPYKIMSFDIEASSSHGDFPIPVKSYKKLATNIVDYFTDLNISKQQCSEALKNILLFAFGFTSTVNEKIETVYPKKKINTEEELIKMFELWINKPIILNENSKNENNQIEKLFETMQLEYKKTFVLEELPLDEDSEDVNENSDEEDDDNTIDNNICQIYNNTIVDLIKNTNIIRELKINLINDSLFCKGKSDNIFPELEGDKVTFIGSTFMYYGDKNPYKNHCAVLNSCVPITMGTTENTLIESYNNEKDVLLAWQKLVQKENPDIVIGYNIFGFDYAFMFKRAEENNCAEEFLKLSRNRNEICGTLIKDSAGYPTGKYKLEESSIQLASGQYDLRFIKMAGRLQIDLYNHYRRVENLSSYKLDYVSGYFIGDYVKSYSTNNMSKTEIVTNNMTGLLVGSFIHFEEIDYSVDYYDNGAKFEVIEINKEKKQFKVEGLLNLDLKKKIRWCLAKDDVTPKDIFRMTNGTAEDRSVIAKYCIQDCNLVHYLLNKSDALTGYIEMSKICSIPINFLIMRGQGIKLTSCIAKKCLKNNTLIPVIEKNEFDDGYEGAIVLEPKCGLYLSNPIACVDYAGLYPSSMISENLSHDSKVWTKEYDLSGNLVKEWGEKDNKNVYIYDNLPGREYVDVEYDTYRYIRANIKKKAIKVKIGYKICRYIQPYKDENGNEVDGIIPSILKELLKARKDTRKLIPGESDEFMKAVLEQRQLGYKLTANSLYGGCGARTSSFYEKDIAACTTATGRKLLTYAKKVIEETYGNKICETEKYGQVLTKAEYIYGDTDSVFFTFNLQTPSGELIDGKKALEITIELAQQAGHLASSFLKEPHDLEYEKTFMPFCLLSKKRYVGMLYETDPNKCKRKEMGIVLKRRDNAPIVKDIYGGIIDILMKTQNIKEAINFLQTSLKNVVDGNCPIEKLIITKSLRSGYKKPNSIAHKVLADRIAAREPGNKPSPGDRIPFVYFVAKNAKKLLQGDKIETPTFIIENKLKIDYEFYITNQIMKPIQQLFSLVIEQIWQMQNKLPKLKRFKKDVEMLRKTYLEDSKFQAKLEKLKNDEIKLMLFNEFLVQSNNNNKGLQNVTTFFTKK